MLHHICDVTYDENMCGPMRTCKCSSANWLINYIKIWLWFELGLMPEIDISKREKPDGAFWRPDFEELWGHIF